MYKWSDKGHLKIWYKKANIKTLNVLLCKIVTGNVKDSIGHMVTNIVVTTYNARQVLDLPGDSLIHMLQKFLTRMLYPCN